jgi:hypothetical protein
MHDATASVKSPKKFHIFHERHLGKCSSINKRCSPAENSMIAASHPKEKPSVMRKPIGQPVHSRLRWQANPKETATYCWITHYSRNLIQRFQRNFGVCMQKPENIAGCSLGSGVHLFRPAAFDALDHLIAKSFGQPIGAVSTRAVDDNNFRPTGALAQIREK